VPGNTVPFESSWCFTGVGANYSHHANFGRESIYPFPKLSPPITKSCEKVSLESFVTSLEAGSYGQPPFS
jgi:hypothetical protein